MAGGTAEASGGGVGDVAIVDDFDDGGSFPLVGVAGRAAGVAVPAPSRSCENLTVFSGLFFDAEAVSVVSVGIRGVVVVGGNGD